ncbi:FAD-dependent oxidoreductase [Achromobacter marplatensis]|uniref:FAD-dependent oxidoreductase n=1 Tax=Achromobacter marplatensis TaxID=470868 RepID=UPI0039F6DD51
MTPAPLARVRIQLDGRPVNVAAGSSVAAALAARAPGNSRISITGENRAAVCGMGVCHECRVLIDGQLRLACQTPCQQGMHIETVLDAGTRAAPAAALLAGHDNTCDLLIIGAGPAGMAAALAAAPSGRAIVVVDDNPAPGGQIWRDGPAVTLPASARHQRDQLARYTNIRMLCGTRVAGLAGKPGSSALLLENARQGWVQHYGSLILCTGARELLLPFPGWTLPGVTGAGGLQALIKGGVPVRGQRIVIAGSGPLLLAAARSARHAGATVVRIAEQAAWPALLRFSGGLARWPGKALQAAALLHPQYRGASHVLEARGDGRLQHVRLRRGRQEEQLACHRLACGFGLVPNTQLGQMLGCALNAHGGLQVDDLLQTGVPGVYAAGECTGVGGSERAGIQGAIAGYAAIGELARATRLAPGLARWQAFANTLRRHFSLAPAVLALARPDTLVCRCEDVPQSALATCDSWIDAKLHTRCGMGACQGRVCGAATQALYGWQPMPSRHLLTPTRIDTLAGFGHLDGHAHAPNDNTLRSRGGSPQ